MVYGVLNIKGIMCMVHYLVFVTSWSVLVAEPQLQGSDTGGLYTCCSFVAPAIR